MDTVLQVVDNLESIQEETRSVQVVLAATPNSASGNTMPAIDHSRTSNETQNATKMKTTHISPLPCLALPAQRSYREKDVNHASDEVSDENAWELEANRRPGVNRESDEGGDDESDDNGLEPEANRRPEQNIKKRARCDHDEKDFHLDSFIQGVDLSGNECRKIQDPKVSCDNERIGNKALSLEKRFAELIEFKNNVGHFNVPARYAENPALGGWCSRLRHAYNKLQKGETCANLPEELMERLEKVGFKWNGRGSKQFTFDERFAQLTEFKNKFGHCEVTYRYTENPALGRWCSRLRIGYRNLQKGHTCYNLSEERIELLENIGFKWNGDLYVFVD